MPDPKIVEQSGNIAALASATSKRKKQEFAEIVAECQEVIKAWGADIEAYINLPREQPASPAAEVEYWRCRTATLTSVENQLKTKRARVVQMVLSKSPLGVVDMSKWKAVDLMLTEAKVQQKANHKKQENRKNWILFVALFMGRGPAPPLPSRPFFSSASKSS